MKDGTMSRLLKWTVLSLTLICAGPLHAQITPPRKLSTEIDRFATLEERLINRLRATREDQQAYIKFVVNRVRKGKLDVKLVVAIEQYAMRRNPHYPFPFFERALKFEASKRGIPLPSVRNFNTTRIVP
jgi:hypothetical protein